ncbi:pilus assembly protein PilB [bacterium]|nr:MAG: pilus assembly protein PilB [bacterium]
MSFNPQFQKVGDILVHQGVISEDQLQKALAEQKKSNEKLGQILINQGIITEADLVKAYSQQMGHKHVLENDLLMLSEDNVSLLSEEFARANHVIAMKKTDSGILVAMEDPEDLDAIDGIRKITGLNPEIVIAGRSAIETAIGKLYGTIKQSDEIESAISNISVVSGDEEDSDEVDLSEENVSAEEAPFVKLVNLMLSQAIKEGSTDIHVEPGKNEVIIRIRIDGVLSKIMSPPITSLNGMITRIKILSKLNIAEHRLPQDGRMKLKMGKKEIDVRVSILPTVHGEKAVLRLLGSGDKELNLTNLGFPNNKLTKFKKWINQPYGMVIISGPTGSGKSTTLYAALQEIKNDTINITTVEDPVEYQIPGINQIQVHEKIGLSFAAALRSILRQDPDVLLIGEIRDQETADIAVKFSMTGHLVFSTVHANDAPSTISRLLDLGVPPFLLGSSLNLIMAQRLIRTIDSNEKEQDTPTNEQLQRLGIAENSNQMTFYKGKPTQQNHNTGYKGRTAIHEILEVNSSVREMIFEGKSEFEIKDQAIKNGMTPLRDAGIDKIKEGVTTVEEVLRATVEDN